MAPDAEVVTIARVDLDGFMRKMDEHDRRLDKSTEKAKRGAVFGGIVGGAIGGFAGSAIEEGAMKPFGGILELFGNLIAAALLPVVAGLLPVLQKVGEFLLKPEVQKFLQDAGKIAGDVGKGIVDTATDMPLMTAGAAVGWKFGGPPGAFVGGVAGGTVDTANDFANQRGDFNPNQGNGPGTNPLGQWVTNSWNTLTDPAWWKGEYA